MAKEHKYDDRKKELLSSRKEAESQFDKLIIYISAGAFVFSVGFVKDIVGDNHEPQLKLILVLSWCLFGLSLLTTLLSQVTFKTAIDYLLKKINLKEQIENKEKEDSVPNQEKLIQLTCKKKAYDDICRGLNISSLICLFLGAISMSLS